jgi:hypothetical protein
LLSFFSLIAALVFPLGSHAQAPVSATADLPYELNQAEYGLWQGQGLPDDSVTWTSTRLPFIAAEAGLYDEKSASSTQSVWFRFLLEKPVGTEFISLLLWRYNLSVTVYFNGEEVASNGSRPNRLTTGWNRPLLANISNSQWLEGDNEVLVRLETTEWRGQPRPCIDWPA